MKDLTINLMTTIYFLYVAYALYAGIAVFFRPDDRGQLFKNLRVPIVVIFYFLLPCFALYALHKAFATTYPPVFWSLSIILGGFSYTILLYFVTSPDWPIGRLLALEKINPSLIRVALIVNFSLASIVLAASTLTIVLLNPAIESTSRQPEYVRAVTEAQRIETVDQANKRIKTEIERGAIADIWTSTFGMLEKLFGTIGAACSCIVGYLGLRKSRTS